MFFKHAEKREIISNLTVYGVSHAVIDATCAALAFGLLASKIVSQEYFITLVIIYNAIAFGTQPLFGLMADKCRNPKIPAIIGSVMTAFAVLIAFLSPLSAAIIAGIGNALFHIGGGTISLNLIRNKATAPGIFVAPGALGLLIGTLIGKSGNFAAWPFAIIIAFLCLLMYKTRHPEIDYEQDEKINAHYFELIILLLFLAVAVRSLIGSAVVLPWKSNLLLLVILTIGVVLGKVFGGIFGDRYGWTKIAVISLIISAPLLAFGATIPYLAIIGMFLFNITMPITLVAISNTLPGRPGFSFGLTTLALIIGAFPAYTRLKNYLPYNPVVFAIIIISAILLFFGLKLYTANDKSNDKSIIGGK